MRSYQRETTEKCHQTIITEITVDVFLPHLHHAIESRSLRDPDSKSVPLSRPKNPENRDKNFPEASLYWPMYPIRRRPANQLGHTCICKVDK